MEKTGAQPLGIPSLLLPLLFSVPPAPSGSALQNAPLRVLTEPILVTWMMI